jgi:hypothetical protein
MTRRLEKIHFSSPGPSLPHAAVCHVSYVLIIYTKTTRFAQGGTPFLLKKWTCTSGTPCACGTAALGCARFRQNPCDLGNSGEYSLPRPAGRGPRCARFSRGGGGRPAHNAAEHTLPVRAADGLAIARRFNGGKESKKFLPRAAGRRAAQRSDHQRFFEIALVFRKDSAYKSISNERRI